MPLSAPAMIGDGRAGRLTGRRRRTRRHARKRRRARSWRRALPHRAAERLWRRAGLRHFHMPAEDRALFTPGDSAEPPLGKLIIVEDNAICRGPVVSGPFKVQQHVLATSVVALGADSPPSTTTRRPGVYNSRKKGLRTSRGPWRSVARTRRPADVLERGLSGNRPVLHCQSKDESRRGRNWQPTVRVGPARCE